MDIDLNRFRETFFQEAAEHISDMETALLGLADVPADAETLNAIFRGAHSMKAGAGMFGFEHMMRFTHELESLLDRLRAGEIEVKRELVELLLHSVDVLKELVDYAARGDTNAVPAEMDSILERLAEARSGGVPAAGAGEAARGTPEYLVRFAPSPEMLRLGLDPFLVLRDLSNLGHVLEVEADVSGLPSLEALDPETCYLSWNVRLSTAASENEIRDVFAFVEDVASISIEAVHPAKDAAPQAAVPMAAGEPAPGTEKSGRVRHSGRESSIRVATDKVDRLIDLVGELVIAQSMATEAIHDFRPERLARLAEAIADMERYTRELQERVMRIRMLPVGTIFSRFPRLVHDAATALQKQVTLEVSGEETELDKGVVEQMADPLTHLVRNAVDHGIEPPEERVRAGKPAAGTVRLNAHHQGGNVIVEVSDDGRGLNVERIREKGIERGLINAGDELTDDQVCSLIFCPGFSTAATVSELSGRGVGMDVVKRSVETLNGTVTFSNHPGRGASFRIKLPLTLAVLDGLLLRVGEQTFVLPLVSIVESIQPRSGQLRSLSGRGEVVMVRREPLRLLRLHQLFAIPDAVTDPSRGLVAIVEHEGRHVALLVDELLGQQQVVIKSLETNYRKVDGITGATILGDGRAALILDVAGIVQMGREAQAA